MFASITLAILLIVGGGAYASEQSLPGNPLYPVKVHIMEEVRAAIAVTPKAKAKLETTLAGRRLEELEHLSTQNKLKTKVKEQLEAQFELHTTNATQISSTMESQGNSSDALEIQSDVEAALTTHSEIISRINEHIDEINEHIEQTVKRVEKRTKEVTKQRSDIEINVRAKTNIAFQTQAERKQKSTRRFLDDTKVFIEQKTFAETELRTEAVDKLKEAESAYLEADAKLKTQAFAESFTKFQESQRRAQEARLLITTLNKLEIKIDRRKKNNDEHNQATSTIEIDVNGKVKKFDGLKNLNINIPIPGGNLIFKNEQDGNDGNEDNNDGINSTPSSGVNLNSNTMISTSDGSISSQSSINIKSNSTIRINSNETWINGVRVDDEEGE